MISAKVLLDSVHSVNGVRLVTMELEYPRYIHAEFMTHRVFSRNASSSRAIPVAKLIDKVEAHPVMPVEWGMNKPGMQAGEPISRKAQTEAEGEWVLACYDAVKHARKLKDLGVHKQITNRLLEPFSTIKVIVTSTEWSNFFNLRISPLAQPEIRSLAEKMKWARDESTSKILSPGLIHAPFVTHEELRQYDFHTNMMLSAARCARVSYLNHDGLPPDYDKDLALATRLLSDKHASCFEHQAMATGLTSKEFSNNFRGWTQFRSVLGL